jgi:hypothetical protein
MKNEITAFLKQEYNDSLRFLKPKMFIKRFGQDVYNNICDFTLFLEHSVPFSRRVYCFLNDISATPLCKVCNKEVKYNHNTGYQKYCSNACRLSDIKNIQDIKRQTNIRKYGTTNVLTSVYGKAKKKETCIEKYGVDNYVKTDEYKNRIKTGDITRVYNTEKNKIVSREKYYKLLAVKYPTLTPLFCVDEYRGANSYDIVYPWQCVTCNKKFEHWINNNYPILCPYCKPKGTYYENVLKKFFEKYNIEYIFRDRKKLNNLEIDFYLPGCNLGIEINGLYWHSEKNITDRNYHFKKTEEALANNIRLIQIFEDEFYSKQAIVFSRLKHILNLQTRSIYARECCIESITNHVKSLFNEKYHIQGDVNTSINYGLYYKKRLVAVMTFSKLRKALGSNSEENVYELVRYCTVKNFNIVGGAGKLLKYFCKNNNVKKIISYADRRWSLGSVYEAIGFTREKITSPNYWYTKNYTTRLHRFNFQKHLLKGKLDVYDENLTEWENMKANGYTRVWDCGHLKYVMQT